VENSVDSRPRLVLVGASGMLASMVSRLAPKFFQLFPLDLPGFDITDLNIVSAVLHKVRPEFIVNCAAYTNVDGCETDAEMAARVNGEGPGNLAAVAKKLDATLVHVSTDYVFDGKKGEAYVEGDTPNPLSAYGRSKLLGEQAILQSGLEKYFIVRTSWLYGPGGKNFVETIVRLASEREELRIIDDQIGSPTFTRDLAQAIFSLLMTDEYGIYHFSDEGQCSWFEFGKEIVDCLSRSGGKVKVQRIAPIATHEYPLPAHRPAYSVFSKEKYRAVTGAEVPHWRDSLAAYFRIRRERLEGFYAGDQEGHRTCRRSG